MKNFAKTSLAILIVTWAAGPSAIAANEIVNPQITDAETQANVKILGDAPATAVGNLMVATSQALGNSAHNATSSQQNANPTLQAATTQGVLQLYDQNAASK